uniref:Octanoyltransferase n=1 Tax=Dictyoglomus thermophilum TaxID=14 RepID=A0A7C3MJ46_DICTH
MGQLVILNLPKVRYLDAWELQRKLHSLRVENLIPDTLILLEHYPVITLGKFGKEENLLKTKEELNSLGIEYFHVDRGGDITYHGPGQLVGYFVFRVEGVKNFIFKIENALIKLLEEYRIESGIDVKNPGVWVGNKKIAAIGVAIKKRVSYHGFALNVNNDLTPFSFIIPCGLKDKEVTSIKEETHRNVDFEDLKNKMGLFLFKEFYFSEFRIINFSSYMEDSILEELLVGP